MAEVANSQGPRQRAERRTKEHQAATKPPAPGAALDCSLSDQEVRSQVSFASQISASQHQMEDYISAQNKRLGEFCGIESKAKGSFQK